MRADRRAAAWLVLALVAGLAATMLAWAAGQGRGRRPGTACRPRPPPPPPSAPPCCAASWRSSALPFVLAEDPDLRATLADPTATRLEVVNRKLERLRDGTGADVIYLIDTTGMTLAASNWREETSFVGNDYRFRQYFQDGLRLGAAEQFALGTVSQRPGLYISRAWAARRRRWAWWWSRSSSRRWRIPGGIRTAPSMSRTGAASCC
ncbi:hypothetical protein ACFQU7_07470 [Pseudoroseomonas wenyumeiae]